MKELQKHQTTINYIEALTQKPLDVDRLIELGLEALKDEAERDRNIRNFRQAMLKPEVKPEQTTLYVAVRAALPQQLWDHWDEFAEAILSEHPHLESQLNSIERSNENVQRFNPYYWRSLYINDFNRAITITAQGMFQYDSY